MMCNGNCEYRKIEYFEEYGGGMDFSLDCEESCPYKRCKVCEERFEDYFITDGICHECAKKEYTDSVGLDFIRYTFNEGEPNIEFNHILDFLNFYYPKDDIVSDEVAVQLLRNIEIAICIDTAMHRESKERKSVKEFCLEVCDIELWIDYLKASGACDV